MRRDSCKSERRKGGQGGKFRVPRTKHGGVLVHQSSFFLMSRGGVKVNTVISSWMGWDGMGWDGMMKY